MTFKEWKDLPTWFKVMIYSLEAFILVGVLFYFLKDL